MKKRALENSNWLALGFLAATALAYLPAWNGRPIWDDDRHLTRPALQSPAGLARIWTDPQATQQYYPVVHTVFWLEHRAWGDALLPYHLLNIFLHGFSAFLLFKILTRLRVPGALLAGALFALHPVQVESVAWISELKNTLSGFFFFTAAWFYLRFDESRRRAFYLGALGLFILGLLSKSVIATLPPALLVIFWWKRGRISIARDLRPLLPFFVLGISSGLFTAWIERNYIGAEGAAFQLSLGARVLLAGRAFWFYLAKLFWPNDLTFVYPRWQLDPAIWWQYLFPAALLALLFLLWKLRDKSRGPLAGVLFFLGTLFPVLGFVNVFPFIYSFVADHFQYLASAGILTLVAAGITRLLERFRLSQFLGAIPVLVLGVLTCLQCRIYASAEVLYRTTLARNPAAWMAQNNLANILMRNGATAEAAGHYQAALALRPEYLEAHYNLGNALLQLGQLDESIAQCQAALVIDPRSAEAHNNLANALLKKRRFREALDHYEQAHALAPGSIDFENNLADFLSTAGETSLRDGPRALELATQAVHASRGQNPIVLQTLGVAYAQVGQMSEAIATTQRALQLARAQGNQELVAFLQKRLELFARYQIPPAND